MPNDVLALLTGMRGVGSPALLGLRPRFMDRVMTYARDDERLHALALWGPLARGDADEWSGVEYVAVVADETISEFLDELLSEESRYGRSLLTLQMPQNGVEGGGFLSVTYLRSGLPLQVNWYVCPRSLGLPIRDTKPLFAREGWPSSGRSFAELLVERPSKEFSSPPHWDQVVAAIPTQIAEVARGRPEVVVVDGAPLQDRGEAYAALARHISELPETYADVRFALYAQLGIARHLFR